MTGLEIALLVLGTLFVIISFFIVGEKNTAQTGEEKGRTDIALTEGEKEDLKKSIRDLLDREQDNTVRDTDASLDRLSNEKIIAVTEVSDQVLEKISANHKEVVFLYDMLQKKEEELKDTASELEDSRRQFAELYEKMSELAKEEEERLLRAPAPLPPIEEKKPEPAKPKTRAKKAAEAEKKPAKAPAKKPAKKEAEEVRLPDDIAGLVGEENDPGLASRNEKILSLHKKNKSIMEISKLMDMGQGEVKLVIDLYGDK